MNKNDYKEIDRLILLGKLRKIDLQIDRCIVLREKLKKRLLL
jgi:hypothetical protein